MYTSDPKHNPQPHAMLVGGGRVLTVIVTERGGLEAIYCVDVTCLAPLRSELLPSITGVSNPTVVPDPAAPTRPFVAFFHTNHTGLAVTQCLDITCAFTTPARTVASTREYNPEVERFTGELAVGHDPAGHFHMTLRRYFSQVNFHQVMVISCDVDVTVPCTERAIASGPEVGAGLGDNCLAMRPDRTFAVLWRDSSGPTAQLHVTLCPAFPTPCSAAPVRRDMVVEDAARPHGLFGYQLHAQGPNLHAFYSGGADAATAHPRVWHCLGDCAPALATVRAWAELPAQLLAMEYHNASSMPMLTVGTQHSLQTIYCVDPSCNPQQEGYMQLSAPPFIGGLEPMVRDRKVSTMSSAQYRWAGVAALSDGTLQLSVWVNEVVPRCDQQGRNFVGCTSVGESCDTQMLSGGIEGTCICTPDALPAPRGTTPGGCCSECSAALFQKCMQGPEGGQCGCIDEAQNPGVLTPSGKTLQCGPTGTSVAPLSTSTTVYITAPPVTGVGLDTTPPVPVTFTTTTPPPAPATTPAPDVGSVGRIAGIVVGSGVAAALLVLLVVMLWRKRALIRNRLGTAFRPYASLGESLIDKNAPDRDPVPVVRNPRVHKPGSVPVSLKYREEDVEEAWMRSTEQEEDYDIDAEAAEPPSRVYDFL